MQIRPEIGVGETEEKPTAVKPSGVKIIVIAAAVIIGILIISLIGYFVFRKPAEVPQVEEPVEEGFLIEAFGDIDSPPKIEEMKVVEVEVVKKSNQTLTGEGAEEVLPFDIWPS